MTVCFALLIIAALIAYIIVLVQAILATFHYGKQPCDQPLKIYILVTIGWDFTRSQLSPLVMRLLQPRFRNHIAKLVIGLLLAIPGWAIIFWGVFMVTTSKTCSKTNPFLYFPIKRFIYMQVGYHLAGLFVIMTVILVLSLVSLRWLTTLLSRLRQNPGCAAAVRRLPKIAPDSSELIDPEDGSAMDCAICMDRLSGSPNLVVRCPCDHYYHDECLLEWCQSHLDCPLCRTQVGEPDRTSDGTV